MLHKQERKCSTSLLELEAAEYFKLDLSQMNLGLYDRRLNSNMINRRSSGSGDLKVDKHPAETRQQTKSKNSNKCHRIGRSPSNRAKIEISRSVKRHTNSKGNQERDKEGSTSADRSQALRKESFKPSCKNGPSKALDPQCHGGNSPLVVVGSSTTSTNSLPSITSSPSVSPSLVCPHLSLEDILDCSQTSSRSPHTIGLCPKCRLDPPPNIHSPLSPQFRPSSRSLSGSTSPKRVTRGYSDQQGSYCSVKEARKQQQQQAASQQITKAPTGTIRATGRHQSDLGRLRDDSLDFCLELPELRRMQMSPTLRNSVEFIRRNSIESARIVRIFKNGQPFEKPLRVCILRGEFSSLNHLLDHINSRLLIPLGARYLFHLDGQLVYSVHELKHESIYVVSGSRVFDYRTSEVLKEQQKREQTAKLQQEHRAKGKQRRRPEQSPSKISSRDDVSKSVELKETKILAETAKPKQADSKWSMNFRSIEPRNSVKSGRSDMSNLEDTDEIKAGDVGLPATRSNEPEERPIRVTRAKSELSALPPKKQKKNVTFMDTGRGSSPAISELSSSRGDEPKEMDTRRTVSTATLTEPVNGEAQSKKLKQELVTSEIGIQVSDSIDGFLIDLPVALPARGDDSNLISKPRPRPSQKYKSDSKDSQQVAHRGATRPTQIVTITERQLSSEEMTELTDLSEGDHHDRREVTIEWNSVEEPKSSIETATGGQSTSDHSSAIPTGSDPQVEEDVAKKMLESGKLVTSGLNEATKTIETETDGHWQYPGGDAASSTPTERPVSQSGPSESIRARVTTPTPSLSTGGDNNSLTLSYDTIMAATSTETPEDIQRRLKRMPSLADRQRKEVMGILCDGLDAPTRNFRLVWVNGFAINDLYPENSVDVQRLTETCAGGRAASNEPPSSATGSRLSPAVSVNQQKRANEFRPSERYHNFVCHSRKYDELVFPAGALVVLWCRWTNEQRYYAQHSSNVTCLALATLDLDLAASAQVGDSSDRLKTGSLIHLWSLSSLSLLRVLEDDQYKSKSIYSMRLKNSKSEGCELSVAARDEKQLFLFEFAGKLEEDEKDKRLSNGSNDKRRSSRGSIHETKRTSESGVMMRACKMLQSNQSPLFVLRVPKLASLNQNGDNGETKRQQKLAEPLISFGRRHFSMWSPDVRQRKLRPMQADEKSAKFGELIAKANCLCRISPDEFLLGDSEGNVTLLTIGCDSNQTPTRPSAKGKLRQKSKVASDQVETRYSVRTSALLSPNSSQLSEETGKNLAICCLARISGSLFMSADSSCTIRFWRMKRSGGKNDDPTSSPTATISCEQLRSICLPPDLGFICTLLLARYNLKDSLVEFYVISTSNSILFGSVKLPQRVCGRSEQTEADLLSTCSLSVVYEGHETHASGLVADSGPNRGTSGSTSEQLYFTCSLDCRICKWSGKQLLWKSMLPSACVSLAVHPLGNVLAVGSVDGTVYILDKTSGLLISYFPLTPVRINCLAYSSDGSLLAAGCVSGSIFMLPVDELGLKYKKVSIFQSPNAVVSLQFSLDNRYMLTSVSHSSFQELILWDLPNFRYMRDDVKLAADKIEWFDAICSGSEDVRAIWENSHLTDAMDSERKLDQAKRSGAIGSGGLSRVKAADQFVVNLSCHRLIRTEPSERFVVASDTRGYLRLFQYPAYDIQQGFFAIRIGPSAVNCCRFLESARNKSDHFVSTSLDGSICLWTLEKAAEMCDE